MHTADYLFGTLFQLGHVLIRGRDLPFPLLWLNTHHRSDRFIPSVVWPSLTTPAPHGIADGNRRPPDLLVGWFRPLPGFPFFRPSFPDIPLGGFRPLLLGDRRRHLGHFCGVFGTRNNSLREKANALIRTDCNTLNNKPDLNITKNFIFSQKLATYTSITTSLAVDVTLLSLVVSLLASTSDLLTSFCVETGAVCWFFLASQ